MKAENKSKELTNRVNGAPRKRLVNCFGLGLAENGRLGIGPPDDLRQVEEAGFVIGWHQPEENGDFVDTIILSFQSFSIIYPDESTENKVGNRRARRTHVRGLAR